MSSFYQHSSVAYYASADVTAAVPEMSVHLSAICQSDTLWYCIKMDKAGIMISSSSESTDILVLQIPIHPEIWCGRRSWGH